MTIPAARRALLLLAAAALGSLFAALPLACSDDPSSSSDRDASLDASLDADAAPDPADGADAARPVVPRGARALGIAVAIDDTDFPSALVDAREAGAQTTNVTFGWNDIERPADAGAADASDPDAGAPPTVLFNPAIHVVNLVLGDRRVEATLAVEAFDVGGSRAPADLAGMALDDPALGARYDALLDYVFSQLGDTKVNALLVATGADAWLTADAQRAAPLAAFVTRAAAHARTLRPGLKVGFTVDDLDAMRAQAAALAPAWTASDFVGVDYLPAAAVARGEMPAAFVSADFDRMAEAAPAGRPIVLRQAGYPTAAAAGPAASEENQGRFVAEVFAAWDRRPERFTSVVFRELADATAEEAAALALRRGRSDAPFLAALQSLGMRARDGREKQAFSALRREARSRGW